MSCPLGFEARKFLNELGIASDYLDPAYDRCYCSQCHPSTYHSVIGEPGTPSCYVVPRGWYRFGLARREPQIKADRVFETCEFTWGVAYHGVKSTAALQSILAGGQLLLPGNTLTDGTVLKSSKCAGRQDNVYYTSPEPGYAGLKFYAEPLPYDSSKRTGDDVVAASVMVQLRQKPGTFAEQTETMRFQAAFGAIPAHLIQHVPAEQLERYSNPRPPSCIPYGLLVRPYPLYLDPQEE